MQALNLQLLQYVPCVIRTPALNVTCCLQDYENLQIQWGSQENYEVVRKVGRGKVCGQLPQEHSTLQNVACMLMARTLGKLQLWGLCGQEHDKGHWNL